MLERVVIQPGPVDVAALAEAIVYYGNVEFVCFNGHLSQMVRQIGMDATIRLAESDLVQFVYRIDVTGIMNDADSMYPHSFWTISPAKKNREKMDAEGELRQTFASEFGKGAIGIREIRRLVSAMDIYQKPDSKINDFTLSSLADKSFLNGAIQHVVRGRIPGYPNVERLHFECDISGERFALITNFDYELASNIFQKLHNSPDSKINSGYLVVPISNMVEIMSFAGPRKCDIWADDTASKLLMTRVESFSRRISRGIDNIGRFNEKIFHNRAFGDAIKSGDRTIDDVLNFAESDETRKFKKWISEAGDDADLLAEYEKSRVAPSKLASSLPVKAARLVLFASAGAGLENIMGGSGVVGALSAAVASETVLSLADEWLLSQFKYGWRPSHWVADTAAPFLRG